MAHAPHAGHDFLQRAFVVGELPAQLLDHAVDVIELGLLRHLRGEADHRPRGHVDRAVHPIHLGQLFRRRRRGSARFGSFFVGMAAGPGDAVAVADRAVIVYPKRCRVVAATTVAGTAAAVAAV